MKLRFGMTLLLVTALLHPSYLIAATVPSGNQQGFATPQEAVSALVTACEHKNAKALLKLFGPDGKDIIDSGDSKQDKQNYAEFAKLAKEKTVFIPDPMDAKRMILSIGNEDWPFPIPLVSVDGQWHFDPPQGRQEILARRIGANELNAIEICHGYVEAQYEYAQAHREKDAPVYAQKMVSSRGKQDGLYWEASKGAPPCTIPKAFAKAAVGMTDKNSQPYHGYYFAILKAQGPDATGGQLSYVVNGLMIGGFGLIAWPAEYGVSGVQSFIINHDGMVYEKTLGPDPAAEVQKITEYNPDKSWRPVQ